MTLDIKQTNIHFSHETITQDLGTSAIKAFYNSLFFIIKCFCHIDIGVYVMYTWGSCDSE